uniref:Bifunctional nuclease family protein n=1 Tax=Geobacter metallireducens TaxID=28232 RepID=A0A831U334_GEOME
MYLKMNIHGFALDSIAQRPVVLLKDADEANTIPIWINSADTLYIVAELVRHDAVAKSDRKDLLSALLGHLDAAVEEIVIEDMKDGLFDALVGVSVDGETVMLPVRISEALVLALKLSLPVMVADHLLKKISQCDGDDDERFSDADARRFVDFLENLDPADLGKYPM